MKRTGNKFIFHDTYNATQKRTTLNPSTSTLSASSIQLGYLTIFIIICYMYAKHWLHVRPSFSKRMLMQLEPCVWQCVCVCDRPFWTESQRKFRRNFQFSRFQVYHLSPLRILSIFHIYLPIRVASTSWRLFCLLLTIKILNCPSIKAQLVPTWNPRHGHAMCTYTNPYTIGIYCTVACRTSSL